MKAISFCAIAAASGLLLQAAALASKELDRIKADGLKTFPAERSQQRTSETTSCGVTPVGYNVCT
jgi:hypothetical protein